MEPTSQDPSWPVDARPAEVDDELFARYDAYVRANCDGYEDGAADFATVRFTADFGRLLEAWLATRGRTLAGTVRCFMPTPDGFAMLHGWGYDWRSADLCGGEHGRAWPAFEEWCAEQGIELLK